MTSGTPVRRARVVAIGDVGSITHYHVGDEALLDSVIASARNLGYDVEWTVLTPSPPTTAHRSGVHGVPSFGFASDADAHAQQVRLERIADANETRPEERTTRDSALAPTLDAIARANLAVITGGGNLNSSWPAHIAERLAFARCAVAAGVPLAVTGQSIGPELEPAHEEQVREILLAAFAVGTRERSSYAIARRLGVPPGRLRCVIDDAALLVPRAPARVPDGRFMAVTFDPHGFAARDGAIEAVSRQLGELSSQHDLPIVMVPHVGDIGAHSEPNEDVAVSHRIAELVAGHAEVTVADLPEPRVAAWWSAHAELVVSSRYHPVVFALAHDTPALFVWQSAYTRAQGTGALAHYGLERWSLALDDIAAGRLARFGSDLIAQSFDFIAATRERNPELREGVTAFHEMLLAAARTAPTRA